MAKTMSKEYVTTSSAEGIAATVRAAKTKGLPPVHLWNPEFSGNLDMRIARDGTWYYQGTPINRPELARLFSTILKREGEDYFLVTPVEKVRITVDDAPFVAVDFDVAGEAEAQNVTFQTNMGGTVTAGPDNPIRVERDDETAEPSPYVMVHAGLEALVDRKSFYRLVDIGSHHQNWFGIWSGDVFFRMIRSDELHEG